MFEVGQIVKTVVKFDVGQTVKTGVPLTKAEVLDWACWILPGKKKIPYTINIRLVCPSLGVGSCFIFGS